MLLKIRKIAWHGSGKEFKRCWGLKKTQTRIDWPQSRDKAGKIGSHWHGLRWEIDACGGESEVGKHKRQKGET